MATYRVTAPMVLLKIRGVAGQPVIHSFYAGGIVPDSAADLDPANVKRHLDRGWVELLDEAPAPPAEPEQPVDPDAVPEGTADEVRTWVGDNPERAGRALEAEKASAKPRTTLIDQLTKLAGQN